MVKISFLINNELKRMFVNPLILAWRRLPQKLIIQEYNSSNNNLNETRITISWFALCKLFTASLLWKYIFRVCLHFYNFIVFSSLCQKNFWNTEEILLLLHKMVMYSNFLERKLVVGSVHSLFLNVCF